MLKQTCLCQPCTQQGDPNFLGLCRKHYYDPALTAYRDQLRRLQRQQVVSGGPQTPRWPPIPQALQELCSKTLGLDYVIPFRVVEPAAGTQAPPCVPNPSGCAAPLGDGWNVTVTNDLVPRGETYKFADPEFIGKSYMIEDSTVYQSQPDNYFYPPNGAAAAEVAEEILPTFDDECLAGPGWDALNAADDPPPVSVEAVEATTDPATLLDEVLALIRDAFVPNSYLATRRGDDPKALVRDFLGGYDIDLLVDSEGVHVASGLTKGKADRRYWSCKFQPADLARAVRDMGVPVVKWPTQKCGCDEGAPHRLSCQGPPKPIHMPDVGGMTGELGQVKKCITEISKALGVDLPPEAARPPSDIFGRKDPNAPAGQPLPDLTLDGRGVERTDVEIREDYLYSMTVVDQARIRDLCAKGCWTQEDLTHMVDYGFTFEKVSPAHVFGDHTVTDVRMIARPRLFDGGAPFTTLAVPVNLFRVELRTADVPPLRWDWPADEEEPVEVFPGGPAAPPKGEAMMKVAEQNEAVFKAIKDDIAKKPDLLEQGIDPLVRGAGVTSQLAETAKNDPESAARQLGKSEAKLKALSDRFTQMLLNSLPKLIEPPILLNPNVLGNNVRQSASELTTREKHELKKAGWYGPHTDEQGAYLSLGHQLKDMADGDAKDQSIGTVVSRGVVPDKDNPGTYRAVVMLHPVAEEGLLEAEGEIKPGTPLMDAKTGKFVGLAMNSPKEGSFKGILCPDSYELEMACKNCGQACRIYPHSNGFKLTNEYAAAAGLCCDCHCLALAFQRRYVPRDLMNAVTNCRNCLTAAHLDFCEDCLKYGEAWNKRHKEGTPAAPFPNPAWDTVTRAWNILDRVPEYPTTPDPDSPLTPAGLVKLARKVCEQLLRGSADTKDKELARLKAENPVLHSLVRHEMGKVADATRSDLFAMSRVMKIDPGKLGDDKTAVAVIAADGVPNKNGDVISPEALKQFAEPDRAKDGLNVVHRWTTSKPDIFDVAKMMAPKLGTPHKSIGTDPKKLAEDEGAKREAETEQTRYAEVGMALRLNQSPLLLPTDGVHAGFDRPLTCVPDNDKVTPVDLTKVTDHYYVTLPDFDRYFRCWLCGFQVSFERMTMNPADKFRLANDRPEATCPMCLKDVPFNIVDVVRLGREAGTHQRGWRPAVLVNTPIGLAVRLTEADKDCIRRSGKDSLRDLPQAVFAAMRTGRLVLIAPGVSLPARPPQPGDGNDEFPDPFADIGKLARSAADMPTEVKERILKEGLPKMETSASLVVTTGGGKVAVSGRMNLERGGRGDTGYDLAYASDLVLQALIADRWADSYGRPEFVFGKGPDGKVTDITIRLKPLR